MGRSSICTDYYSSQIFELEERPPLIRPSAMGRFLTSHLSAKSSHITPPILGMFFTETLLTFYQPMLPAVFSFRI